MTFEEEVEDCRELWSAEGGWGLIARNESIVTLTVVFESISGPNVIELMALRRLLDDLRHLPPTLVREKVGKQATFFLGTFGSIEGGNLWSRAEREGVVHPGRTARRYLVFPLSSNKELVLSHRRRRCCRGGLSPDARSKTPSPDS